MKSRALRWTLLALFVASLGGAAYVAWTEESAARRNEAGARVFENGVRTIERMLLDIRFSQAGYVAAGQGEDFWASRVDVLRGRVREAFPTLLAQAQHEQARVELEAAAGVFDDFEQMDRRARAYAQSGQRLLASDLVFSDGMEKIDGAAASVEKARQIELNAREDSARASRRTGYLALAGAALVGLFLMAAATPVSPAAPPPAARNTDPEPDRAADPGIPRADAGKPDAGAAAAEAATVPAQPSAGAAVPEPSLAPVSQIDLPAVAALCTELSRIVDSRGLPPALERAAQLMDAAGIVVWIADPDGRELAPIVAHGYPQYLVNRLGTIERNAENVTAAAFRTGLLQIVAAEDDFTGAIAAPLQTPSGPVGVMAAEIRNEGERRDETRAIATILAAQLASLMGPPTRSAGRTDAAGA